MKAKALVLGLLTLFISSFAIAQSSITNGLIGKWEGMDESGKIGSLEFIDSTNIIVTVSGNVLPTGTYKVDTTKNPVWLDITITQGANTFNMTGLVKLVADTELQWQISTSGTRSESFNKVESDRVVVLKKKS